jgi:hypothetical protein
MEVRMSKKVFLAAAVLLIVLTQVSFAQWSVEIQTNYKLELKETKATGTYMWILDQNDHILKYNGADIRLYLEDTNPVFFTLVYNTIKDHLREKKTSCYVWLEVTTYAKIGQIQIR